jgi:hypothetical protein
MRSCCDVSLSLLEQLYKEQGEVQSETCTYCNRVILTRRHCLEAESLFPPWTYYAIDATRDLVRASHIFDSFDSAIF